LYAENSIRERNRTTALGEWTSVAFAAGNFTASGSMTWTVASGDQTTYAYTLIGKTMTLSFVIENSTVGGTGSTELRIAIPGGFTPAKTMESAGTVKDDANTQTIRIRAASGASYLALIREDGNVFDDTSTDATDVRGQISFEIS
jgi:hypothetical protein